MACRSAPAFSRARQTRRGRARPCPHSAHIGVIVQPYAGDAGGSARVRNAAVTLSGWSGVPASADRLNTKRTTVEPTVHLGEQWLGLAAVLGEGTTEPPVDGGAPGSARFEG